jgi:hypothetical protein
MQSEERKTMRKLKALRSKRKISAREAEFVSFNQNDNSVLYLGMDIFHSYILLKKVFKA